MSQVGGARVHFVTNGSLITFDLLERLWCSPFSVGISIDGATRETFEAIRTGSSFERLREKLAMVKKFQEIHAGSTSCDFTFCVVALRSNMHELPDIVRMAARCGIRSVHIADYHIENSAFDVESLRYDPVNANRWFEKTKGVAAQLGMALEIPPPYPETPPLPGAVPVLRRACNYPRLFPAPGRFPKRCYSPWTQPYIRTDGIVVPCCVGYHYLGDLKRNSFAEIWNGWRYRLFRRMIHTTLPPLMCRDCGVAWGINGGNPASVKAKEGLLIKALYHLVRVCAPRLKRGLVRLKATVGRRAKESPPRTPNYFKGRPLSRDR